MTANIQFHIVISALCLPKQNQTSSVPLLSGCKTWSLTVRKDHRFKMFGKKVTGKTPWPGNK